MNVRGILDKTASVLQYYYNSTQWYEQFLQVGRLYRALILLGLALCLSSASVSSVFMMLYRYFLKICLHLSLYVLVAEPGGIGP